MVREPDGANGHGLRGGAWIVLLGAVLLAATLAAAALLLFADERRRFVGGVQARLEAMADDEAATLDQWCHERVADVVLTAGFPTLRGLVDGQRRQAATSPDAEEARSHLADVLLEVVQTQGYTRGAVFDAAGRLLVSTAVDPGPDPTEVESAQRCVQTGSCGVDLYLHQDGTSWVTVCSPVGTGGGGRASGAVVFLAAPDRYLYPALARQPVPTATGEGLLVRREGDHVLFLSPLRFRPDPPLSYRRAIGTIGSATAAAIAGRATFGEYVDYRGKRVFAVGRRLNGAPWSLVVKIDRDEALAPFVAWARNAFSLVGLALLAVGAVIHGVWRRRQVALQLSLARTESRFAALLDHANDAVLYMSADGTILRVNPAATRMYGRPQQELEGMSILRLRPPEGEQDAAATLRRVGKLGRLLFQTVHLRADGSRFPVEVSSCRVEDGGEAAILSVVRDISERKAAEAALREREALYSTFLMASAEGAFLKDEQFRVVLANPTYAAMLGCQLSDVIGHDDFAVMPEPGATACRASDERALASRSAVLTEEKVGDRIYETQKFPVPLGGGRTGVGGFVRDVTDSRQAEEELRLRDGALAAAANAIVVTGVEGEIEWANPAFTKLTGYSLDEVRGTNPRLLKSGVQQPGFYEEMWRTIRVGSVWHGELVNRRKDGTLYTEEMTITPVKDEVGAITHFIAVKQDMTEHKRLEEQLRQSQKMEAVGQLAGGVAHDFNNLLQAMLSQTQLLVAHRADPEQVAADVAELEQQVKRGASLTRQLLLFARRETVRPERLDLNDIVTESVNLSHRLLRENIAIESRLAESKLPVDADRGQLGQVLINLSLNAADAMPAGGRLVVETGANNGTVWVTVTDTGAGIPAAIRDHVFEPFFTTKGQGKGTGLGLSVVHGIVAKHGGTVTFESREGRGTTFVVTLPRAGSGEHLAVETIELGGDAPRGRGERLLVVEDEAAARQALADILTALGYSVTALGSGEEAVALAAVPSFDGLLTDLMLPGISGADLAIVLQARWPALRVVLMSGYTEDEAVRWGAQAGLVRFLQKPFDMVTLARELRAALDPGTKESS